MKVLETIIESILLIIAAFIGSAAIIGIYTSNENMNNKILVTCFTLIIVTAVFTFIIGKWVSNYKTTKQDNINKGYADFTIKDNVSR